MAYNPTLRLVKGSELSWQELDDNFTDITAELNLLTNSDLALGNRVSALETGIAGGTLSSLADVDTSAATSGSTLQFNGTTWVAGAATATVNDINNITNVNTAGAVFGSLLRYNGLTWNAVPGIAVNDLTDADTTGVTNGDTLVWNSGTSKWVVGAGGAGATSLAALTDTTTNTTDDNILAYNSGTSMWESVNTIDCGTY